MTERILVTGATGNVGREVVSALLSLRAAGAYSGEIAAGVRQFDARLPAGALPVTLRMGDPGTYRPALEGVTRIFLMRPPQIGNVRRDLAPLVQSAREAGVAQVVLLSLLGAERRPYLPHRQLERAILASGLPYTFLRPSFFMQNLSTTHRAEIRDQSEILVPAGRSRTSFIDARDIGEVAALTLTRDGDLGQAYDLTGAQALDYGEVAALFTDVLGRPVLYRSPSILRFVRARRAQGDPWPFVLVMAGLYSATRMGDGSTVTDSVQALLGRPPVSLRQFIEDYAGLWKPGQQPA